MEENILKSDLSTDISDDTYWDFFTKRYPSFGDSVAIKCGVTGRKFLYSELISVSERLAGGLHKKGIRKGDVSVIFLPICPEYGPLFLSASKLGAIMSPVNPTFTSEELARQLTLIKPKFIFTDVSFLPLVKSAMTEWEAEIILLEKHPEYPSIHQMIEESERYDEQVTINTSEDVLFIFPSSGTTGFPKGVMLTHKNCTANASQCVATFGKFLKPTTETFRNTSLCMLPLYHSGGLFSWDFNSYLGNTMIVRPKFDMKGTIKIIKEIQFDLLYLVPTFLLDIMNSDEITKEHLKSVYMILYGGAPTPDIITEKVKQKCDPNVSLLEAYGMTECSLTNVALNKRNTVGKLIANTEGKVIDLNTGQALPLNQEGEVCLRGPQVMKGYFNIPEKTAEALKDTWLHSGDIGYYDDDKNLHITGRCKDLIKVHAAQVSPVEIEAMIMEHPGVADAAVVGVPHKVTGEAPKGFIVKKDPSLTEDVINDFLNKKLAPHKQLRGGILFLDSIPRNPTGKILRHHLEQKV